MYLVGKCHVRESFSEKSLTLLLCSVLVAELKSDRIQVVATRLVETLRIWMTPGVKSHAGLVVQDLGWSPKGCDLERGTELQCKTTSPNHCMMFDSYPFSLSANFLCLFEADALNCGELSLYMLDCKLVEEMASQDRGQRTQHQLHPRNYTAGQSACKYLCLPNHRSNEWLNHGPLHTFTRYPPTVWHQWGPFDSRWLGCLVPFK